MLVAVTDVLKQIAIVSRAVPRYALVDTDGIPIKHGRMQVLFNTHFDDPDCRAVFQLILSHAIAAEKMGPGSFDRVLSTLSNNDIIMNVGGDLSCDQKIISGILRASRLPSKQDICALVAIHVRDTSKYVGDIVIEAMSYAGFCGRIMVEKTNSQVASIELSRGYTFNVGPAWSLSTKFERPKVFCVDGYIESVSEVHHLFEAAASAHEPCALFVRGMSDDVLHTVRVNFDRGLLKVVPIIVKFDLNDMNTLNDIATVAGMDVTSSTKGELISSIKFAAAPRVESITVQPGKVVIMNSVTSKSVAAHVQSLRKKRQDSNVDDVTTLLNERIKSLSPNHVIVRLPDDSDFIINSQAIDYALRTVRSAIDYGVFRNAGKVELISTVVATKIHVSRCLKELSDMGFVVTSTGPSLPCEA